MHTLSVSSDCNRRNFSLQYCHKTKQDNTGWRSQEDNNNRCVLRYNSTDNMLGTSLRAHSGSLTFKSSFKHHLVWWANESRLWKMPTPCTHRLQLMDTYFNTIWKWYLKQSVSHNSSWSDSVKVLAVRRRWNHRFRDLQDSMWCFRNKTFIRSFRVLNTLCHIIVIYNWTDIIYAFSCRLRINILVRAISKKYSVMII